MSIKGRFVRPRLLTIILAAVIAASSVTDALCIYDMCNTDLKAYGASEKSKKEEDPETSQASKEREEQDKARTELINAGRVMFDPGLLSGTDVPAVNNSSDALQLLSQVGSQFGISGVSEEYKEAETVDTLDSIYYSFRQMRDNIEVIGGEMTVKTDRNGNVIDISGHHLDIPDTVPTEAKVDESVMKNAVNFLMKKDYGLSDDVYDLRDEGLKISDNGEGEYKLYRNYSVNIENTGEPAAKVAVNAETGKVEGIKTTLKKTYSDDNAKPKTAVKKKDDINPTFRINSEESAELRDDTRNIEIHKVDKQDNVVSANALAQAPVLQWNPKTEKIDTVSLDTLDNLQKTYDFFRDMFYRKGIRNDESPTMAYVGLREYKTGFSDEKMKDNTAVTADNKILIGEKTDGSGKISDDVVSDTDEMGYIFSQGIIKNDSGLADRIFLDDDHNGRSEQDAVIEGVAQVFGELVQDKADNGNIDGSCDWKNAKGDMSAPAIGNYSDYKEFKNSPEEGASLVTYPVYLMQKSGKLSGTQIANLYYSSLPQLSGYSDIRDLRSVIEKNAAKMTADGANNTVSDEGKKLSNEAMEAVIDSFDAVGIPTSFDKTLEPGGKFIVYDKDNKPYQNYNLKLYKLYDNSKAVLDENVASEFFALPGSVSNGLYSAVITDTADESIKKTITLVVNDNSNEQKTDKYASECKIYTDFGMAQRDVVLVLDVSGSMDGTPMEQTRKAASKFVDTVLDASPATRISVVTYSDRSNILIQRSNERMKLRGITENLRTGGGTNMYSGLKNADEILNSSSSKKKMIVLMSDGQPNQGETENGSYSDALQTLTKGIKNKDVTIYSLGFFHSLSGSEKKTCQTLMQKLASPGYYYEVGSADDTEYLVGEENELGNIFNDMADQINGEKYLYIRIACPVDVTVSYNGETLSSDTKNMNTRTQFGTLFITTLADGAITGMPNQEESEEVSNFFPEDESSVQPSGFFSQNGSESSNSGNNTNVPGDDQVKILRLAADKFYEISINGTGEGKMDYSISYPDDEGEYTDVRNFKDVPITKDTAISTNTEQKSTVDLLVDSDGDGKTDKTYSAGQNETAKETNPITPTTIVVIILSVIIAGLLAWEIVLIVKRAKFNKYCQNCHSIVAGNELFCQECGTKKERKNLFLPEKIERKKQSKAVIIVKCAVMGVFALSAVVILIISSSPAVNVYKSLREGNTTFAQKTYRKSVKGSSLAESQTASLTNNYLDKAYNEYKNGNYAYEDMRTVMNNASSLGNSDITKKADEYLKAGEENESKKSEKSDEKKDGSEKKDESEEEGSKE